MKEKKDFYIKICISVRHGVCLIFFFSNVDVAGFFRGRVTDIVGVGGEEGPDGGGGGGGGGGGDDDGSKRAKMSKSTLWACKVRGWKLKLFSHWCQ